MDIYGTVSCSSMSGEGEYGYGINDKAGYLEAFKLVWRNNKAFRVLFLVVYSTTSSAGLVVIRRYCLPSVVDKIPIIGTVLNIADVIINNVANVLLNEYMIATVMACMCIILACACMYYRHEMREARINCMELVGDNARLGKNNEEIMSTNVRLEESKAALLDTGKKYDVALRYNNRLITKCGELKAVNRKQKRDYDNKLGDYNSKLIEERTRNNKLQEECERLKVSCEVLGENKKDLTARCTVLQESLRKQKVSNEELEKDNKKLEARCRKLEESIKKNNKMIKVSNKELEGDKPKLADSIKEVGLCCITKMGKVTLQNHTALQKAVLIVKEVKCQTILKGLSGIAK